jgi:hypothetical protein
MKKTVCRKMLVPLVVIALGGCSSGPSGDYGGEDCGLYDKLSFSDDGKVELYMDGERQTGTYRMQGDQVTVNGQGGSTVFTLVGNNLEVTGEGQRAVCSKL